MIWMLPSLNALVSVINFYPPDILMSRIWRLDLKMKSDLIFQLLVDIRTIKYVIM